MSQLHLAIASTTSKPGAVADNLAQIAGFARRAAADGAQLLLTPELSASGYGNFPEVLATAETAGNGPIYEFLAQTARETGVVICAGFVEKRDDKRHLAHMAIYPDGRFVVQRKHRVTRVESPLEPIVPQLPPFSEWDGTGQPQRIEIETFEVGGVRCAMAICADTGIENLNEILFQRGVQLLLLPVAAGGNLEDRVTTADLQTDAGRARYVELLQTVFFTGDSAADCLKYRRAQAAVNLCGFDGKTHCHMGHGSILNAMGEVVGFFHGLPNLDRQKPMFAHATIETSDCLN